MWGVGHEWGCQYTASRIKISRWGGSTKCQYLHLEIHPKIAEELIFISKEKASNRLQTNSKKIVCFTYSKTIVLL